MSNEITIAFFGATGGCTNACLAHTLKAGYKASALARTPSKLTNMLLAQGIDQGVIDQNLTIVQGDASDVEAVKSTLQPKPNNGLLVTLIVSGVGGTPKMKASITQPMTLDNPTICEDMTRSILNALQQLQSPQKPILTIISTTGISNGPEDVPFGMRAFYHYALAVPHVDKRKMEDMVFSSVEGPSNPTGPLKMAIAIRPSLLVGDHTITSGKGWQTLKVGTEQEPAVGYSIQRADVGEWIFQEIVKTGGQRWFNERVTLTS